jgi:hypothetical protein
MSGEDATSCGCWAKNNERRRSDSYQIGGDDQAATDMQQNGEQIAPVHLEVNKGNSQNKSHINLIVTDDDALALWQLDAVTSWAGAASAATAPTVHCARVAHLKFVCAQLTGIPVGNQLMIIKGVCNVVIGYFADLSSNPVSHQTASVVYLCRSSTERQQSIVDGTPISVKIKRQNYVA